MLRVGSGKPSSKGSETCPSSASGFRPDDHRRWWRTRSGARIGSCDDQCAAETSLGIATAAGLALGLNGLGIIGDTDQQTANAQTAGERAHPPQREGVGLAVEPGEPCLMAKHAYSVAALQTDRRIWTPASATLTDAWACGNTPVLMYGKIQITYEPGWDNVDVDKKWASLAREQGGRIQTVLGRPALVRTPDTALPNPDAPAVPDPADATGRVSVMVVVDGTRIGVSAKGDAPVEKLIELTNSIELPPS